jgi:hypothetical protein
MIMLRLNTTNWKGNISCWWNDERKKSVKRKHYSRLSKKRANAAIKITKGKVSRILRQPITCKNQNYNTH